MQKHIIAYVVCLTPLCQEALKFKKSWLLIDFAASIGNNTDALHGRASNKVCIETQKGLRDRNSPTCTLSQNGYGDRIVSFVHCVSQKSTAFRSQPLHSYFLLSATNLARHALPKFYVISASFQTSFAMLHFPICLQMFLPLVLSFSPHNICLYLHSHIQLINGHTGI